MLGLALLYVAARTYAQTAADRSFDRLITGSALSIAETLSVDGNQVGVDIPYSALDMLSAASADRVFYRILGPADQLITGYGDLPQLPSAAPPPQPGVDLPQYFDANYRGQPVRFVVLRREVNQPSVHGWISIQVGQSRLAREELASELVLRALLPIGAMTLIALVATWFGVGRALWPLGRIGRALELREPTDISPLPTEVPKEIRPLISALNMFMERSGSAMQTLRAFIADAAHQMRTPLAALRAQAQVGADGEKDEMRESLIAIERNAARLSRLLDQLLSDATTIHRAENPHFEEFDLRDVVQQAVHDGVPRSNEVPLEMNWNGPMRMRGDPLMLCEAVKNLLDNALRYGGGERLKVAISLSRSAGIVQLAVSDNGPGIPKTERAKLFKRFARSNNAPGAGLGLAIVERVVARHGGSITLTDTPGGGLTAIVNLPEKA